MDSWQIINTCAHVFVRHLVSHLKKRGEAHEERCWLTFLFVSTVDCLTTAKLQRLAGEY